MKITKSELRQRCIDNETAIATLEALLKEHGITRKQEPKLKDLDQSVFDGLDEKWRFAMVSSVGIPFVYDYKPTGKRHFLSDSAAQLMVNIGKVMRIDEYDYDTSNWQNSLIERDKVELTGSDLCRAMLERGDKTVLCAVSDNGDFEADAYDAICRVDEDGLFESHCTFWWYVRPVNNQGEPLTATDVGL